MNLTKYAANTLLDGGVMPTTLWVQLHIGNPGANGTANVADDDRRVSFTRADAVDGATSNEALLEWLLAPADEDLTHISIHDDSTAGNVWWVGEILDGPASAITGQTTEIPLGLLVLDFETWS